MDKRASFGVVRSEQTRLRGIGGTAGAVGFGTFAGDAFAVQGHFLKEVESLGRKAIMPSSA